jgi:hypothetical protein
VGAAAPTICGLGATHRAVQWFQKCHARATRERIAEATGM